MEAEIPAERYRLLKLYEGESPVVRPKRLQGFLTPPLLTPAAQAPSAGDR